VYHHNLARAIAMGMRILLSRAAMSGPTSVSNAIGPIKRLKPNDLFQIAQLTFRPPYLQAFAISANRDPGGIIAAILQSPQTLNDDGNNFFLSNVANNSAHAFRLLLFGWGTDLGPL
jgi:hypothetical protein